MADSAQTETMPTGPGSPFDYKTIPLSNPSTEIRLLELHPAPSYTDDLSCRIYTAPIAQPPKYIALSYAWGDNTKTHEISVVDRDNDGDGASTDGARGSSLPLTSSLDTCLRHLRELCRRGQVEAKPLWIDQICINQEDDDEKSFQVMLMKDVYSSAHQVIVWLGPAADGSDEVMDAFAHIGQRFHEMIGVPYSDEHLCSAENLIDEKWKTEQSCVLAFIREASEVILALKKEAECWMERSWFTRLWTIQEYCLCQDTMFACGYKVLPVRLVSATRGFYDITSHPKVMREIQGSEYISDLDDLFRVHYQLFNIHERRNHVQYLHRKETLYELLQALLGGYAEFYVTDERVKVYGLLGLANYVDELGIRPDYSPSMTYAQVLTQTARAIIRKNWRERRKRGLGILGFAGLDWKNYAISTESNSSTKNETRLPSWVPEWPSQWKQGERKFRMFSNYTWFSACGKFNIPDLVPTSSPTILGVRGFCVDTVVELGEKVPSGNRYFALDGPKQILGFFDSLQRLLSMSNQNSFAKNIYTTPSHHDGTLWRVPVANQCINSEDKFRKERADSNLKTWGRRFIEYLEDWAVRENEWREYVAFLRDKETAWERHLHRFTADPYFVPLVTMKDNRPYLTKEGYLGLGPNQSQPGDKVVVFHGDTVPYLVRPVPERGDSMYHLVGQAYCDRIMGGELAETAEKEVFYLI